MRDRFPVVMFVSYGPGGADALSSVISHLQNVESVVVLNVVLTEVARGYLTDSVYVGEDEIENLIRQLRPSVVVNERSFGLEVQNRVTDCCKELGILNVVLLDLFGNYEARFTSVPDYVFVPSESIRDDLLNMCMKENSLIVTGNPAYDRLSEFCWVDRDSRVDWLFVSQPFGGIEFELFDRMVDLRKRLGIEGKFVVKMHPREVREVWENRVEGACLLDEGSGLLDCLAFDVVVGYNSTFLYHLDMVGMPVWASAFLDESELIRWVDGEFTFSKLPYTDMLPNAKANVLRELGSLLNRS